ISRTASGRLRLSKSLLPRTSRFQASKRAPRNASSSRPSAWIMVPMAPSSTRMRSAAIRRNSDSTGLATTSLVPGSDIGGATSSPLPEGERDRVRGILRIPIDRVQNLFEYALSVLQHLVVPEPQHQIPHRFQHSRPICFILRRVLPAVEFDNQPRLG